MLSITKLIEFKNKIARLQRRRRYFEELREVNKDRSKHVETSANEIIDECNQEIDRIKSLIEDN